ncbi:MAG: hypothetical protein OQK01_03010, partial [Xanthomonadales bacterium]|nr:hypothetical protein [Xanthomonadales bacterium]
EGGTGGESTFNINVDSARNDAPEIDNNGDGIIDLFGTFTHNFGNSLTIADADVDDGNVDAAAGETDFIQATIALTDSDGTALNLSASGGITLGSTSGLTLVDGDDSDGSLIIQGTFADVQAALTNLEIELANQDYKDTVSLDVTIDDRSRDASGNLTGGANGGTENEDGTPINEANNTSSVTVDFRASDDNDDPRLSPPWPWHGRTEPKCRFENHDIRHAGGLAQETHGRSADIAERVRYPGTPRQDRDCALRGAHAQGKRPFELIAGEFAHAEGHATQFFDKRQLGRMLHLGLLEEDAVHFDFAVPQQQWQDQVQQIAAGPPGAQDDSDTTRRFFRWIGRHGFRPRHWRRRYPKTCR